MRLNLGAGSRHLAGWFNVDIAPIPGLDAVHDLDVAPWPFVEPGQADQIEAKDVFEHVADPITFMVQCHRALRVGGSLYIRTPYYQSRDAFTDPTHRRFPTEHTFDYWIPGTRYFIEHNAAYGGVSFRRIHMEIREGSIELTLRKTDNQIFGEIPKLTGPMRRPGREDRS